MATSRVSRRALLGGAVGIGSTLASRRADSYLHSKGWLSPAPKRRWRQRPLLWKMPGR